MNTSPGTSRTCDSSSQSPRPRTTSTPAIDSAAPSSWRRVTRWPKHRAPIASMNTGVLAATSVTFSGVEVFSARYCKAL